MTKQEFLSKLGKGLHQLPRVEVEEHMAFYSEMIDDRIEEGFLEDEAVALIGSVDAVVSQILCNCCPAKCSDKKTGRLKAWVIVLLVLGSPVWLSFAIATVAVILSLYAVIWSVVVSLWSVFGALIGCAAGVGLGGVFLCGSGHMLAGVAMIGAGAFCAGLSILLFFGCKTVTKGIASLTKLMILKARNRIIRKEAL